MYGNVFLANMGIFLICNTKSFQSTWTNFQQKDEMIIVKAFNFLKEKWKHLTRAIVSTSSSPYPEHLFIALSNSLQLISPFLFRS